MKIMRIYQNRTLQINDQFELDKATSHRLSTVLRLKTEKSIILFNGDGFEYLATITPFKRHALFVHIIEKIEKNLESPLKIHLGQGLSKGDKMEFVVQKATELGVTSITPLLSERTVVHLNSERLENKNEHFTKVAIHASEQCGRTQVPTIEKVCDLKQWAFERAESTRLVLSPTASQTLKAISLEKKSIALLIGPEGGLTEAEVEFACKKGFQAIALGPRILRTETAAIAMIAALQCLVGDFQ